MTGGAGPATEGTAQIIPGTEVRLGRLGFGAAVIGNLYRAVDDDTAADAVNTAWESGIRYFDTAPHYGVGLSERRLGAALRGRPRSEFVVSTKVGRLLVPNDGPRRGRDDEGFDVPDDWRRVRDYSRDGVLRSIEDSLRRTGLDRIDIVFIHDPDDHWAQAADETIPALAELRDQGVVGAIGAGMNQAEMLARFLDETATDIVMLAGRYTLLEQDALDTTLAAAERTGKSVIAAGVFNSGLLSKETVPAAAMFDYGPASADVIERARIIARVCEEFGTTLPAAALAFPWGHPTVVNVTLGMRTAAQVERNVALARTPVPAEFWIALQERSLLRPGCPIPTGVAGI